MQRHHLLPQQLIGRSCFSRMIDALGREAIGFDDFRRNGLLLPASVPAALRVGMPLHRGPHREYNAMVADRVGQIEALWTCQIRHAPHLARQDALFRLDLLQRALRRRLLNDARQRFTLNRKDPFRPGQDFAVLDAMVDQLWAATGQTSRNAA